MEFTPDELAAMEFLAIAIAKAAFAGKPNSLEDQHALVQSGSIRVQEIGYALEDRVGCLTRQLVRNPAALGQH